MNSSRECSGFYPRDRIGTETGIEIQLLWKQKEEHRNVFDVPLKKDDLIVSGDRVHVPLHADGIGAVQLDVHGTGVIQYLLRLAGTAQNVQPRDHAGGQGDDQLRHGAVVLFGQVAPLCQQLQRLCPAGGLEAGVRVEIGRASCRERV